MSTFETVPEGSSLIETVFEEGPLGVTLRRRNQDGVVYVHEIVSGSQAVGLDIEPGDELWSVGNSTIGLTSLDKDAWLALVQYIKGCPRPLTMAWRRRLKDAYDDSVRLSPPPQSPSSFTANSSSDISITPPIISRKTADPPSNPFNINSESPNNVSTYPGNSGIVSRADDPEESDSAVAGLTSRMYIKEKSTLVSSFLGKITGKSAVIDGKTISLSPFLMPSSIGLRQLIMVGDMTIVGSSRGSTVSVVQPNKVFVLFNDVLVICLPYPDDLLIVEDCIHLQVCKLRTFLIPPKAVVDTELPSVFDVIWPGGTIQIGFLTDSGRDEWISAIYKAICAALSYGNDILGWKHQHMLGTIHSAVILRDSTLLQEILLGCENQILDFGMIDSIDDAGFTPLHYATIFRYTNIVQILVDASANVNIPDRYGLTCLHWSSMLLDEESMDAITVHTLDPDIRDYDDRTPLMLTIIEGRDKSGKPNSSAAKRCCELLLNLHADPNVTDHDGRTLLHYVSSCWQVELIEVLLQNKAEIMAIEYDQGMSSLHFATRGVSLRRKISESSKLLGSFTEEQLEELEENDQAYAVPALKVLLQEGSRPNFKDSNGKTPLMHIAENLDSVWGSSVGYAVITLVSYGARFDDSPHCQLLKSRMQGIDIEAIIETRLNAPVIDADAVGISSFDSVRESMVHQFSLDNKDKPIPNCVMCGINFTLFRRQHHCRLCNVLCCDDCSKRRVIIQGKDSRSCDSCYNRVARAVELALQKRNSAVASVTKQASPRIDKSKLFGNSISSQASALSAADSRSNTLSGTMSTMNEAHQRLAERGEKLSQLSDRSAELANAASDFSKLAKQLKDQQKNNPLCCVDDSYQGEDVYSPMQSPEPVTTSTKTHTSESIDSPNIKSLTSNKHDVKSRSYNESRSEVIAILSERHNKLEATRDKSDELLSAGNEYANLAEALKARYVVKNRMLKFGLL